MDHSLLTSGTVQYCTFHYSKTFTKTLRVLPVM